MVASPAKRREIWKSNETKTFIKSNCDIWLCFSFSFLENLYALFEHFIAMYDLSFLKAFKSFR